MQQIKGYRNGHILALALTGGEPFADTAFLKNLSDAAGSLDLIVTVVTNAFWATSENSALEILTELSAIRIFTFSTDVFHQRVIPLENIRNAVSAARQLDRGYTIAICSTSNHDEEAEEIFAKVREFAPEEAINTARVFPVGRASSIRHKLHYEYTSTPPNAACISAHAPVIFPDGRVVACFGPVIEINQRHPLLLGNLRMESLQAILDRAELNPILHAIRVWGPARLIEMVKETGIDKQLPEYYVKDSICCSCYELMRNPVLSGYLSDLAEQPVFRKEVAYARAYYLGETNAVRSLYL